MELAHIFNYDFVQRAFLAGMLIAAVSSILGVFLVLRRFSLIGDGLAHITFGSVLTTPALKDRLMAGLARNEETYYDALERHFIRHLNPLAGKA